MKKSLRLLATAGCFTAGVLGAGAVHAAPSDSVSGQGTLDGGARHFSFSARQAADGTVKGQAQLLNTAFSGTPDSPAPYRAHIQITCMSRVDENTVTLGGMVTRSNDPNLIDAVFFTVQDNGEPGTDDQISRAYFWDSDPDTTGDPQTCAGQSYNLEAIESGNVQVSPSS
jgi:hypothetical protein